MFMPSAIGIRSRITFSGNVLWGNRPKALHHALVTTTLVWAVLLGGCAAPAVPQPPTVATVLPTPAPTPTAGVAIRETFDTGTPSQLSIGDTANARLEIADGQYQIGLQQPDVLVLSAFGGVYTDLAVEAELRFVDPIETTTAGLLFRLADEQNFYAYSLSSDGFYALEVCERGEWRQLLAWTPWPTIDSRGGVNRMRVTLQGDQISLFLNNELLAQTVDTTFSTGRLALNANTYATTGARVTFDNVVASPLTE